MASKSLRLTRKQLEDALGTDHATIKQFERLLLNTRTVRLASSNTTLAADDDLLIMTAGGNITLPRASDLVGKVYTIKRTGSSVTLLPFSPDMIDGSATFSMSTAFQSVSIVSTGSNWVII